MSLISEIAENTSLRFVDESNPKIELRLQDMLIDLFPPESKKLVFLYLDNSLNSVQYLLSVLNGKHTAVLLMKDLVHHFKIELESIYSPHYIFDSSRNEIDGYEIDNSVVFRRIKDESINIDPQIKLLLSTSGTTGSPKFVKLSENNILSNAKSISAYLPIESIDVTPLNLPLYYSYGLSVLTSNALKGGKIICGNTDILTQKFWNNMTDFGYTSIAGVPFVYEMLERIGFLKKTYPSLRYLTQAGGKLANSLIRKYSDYSNRENKLFYVMYGQTEATARMAYLPPENLTEKIGSVGISIPDGRLFISEENCELCYEGKNIYGGYVNNQNDLADYKPEKILRTGDIARMDESGYFYIIGRIKRFVKLFGNRINLDDVENLIDKSFQVSVKCVGVEDKKLLIVSDQLNDQKEKIKEFLVNELKLHHSILAIKEITDIPLTANGKVNYSEIILNYASE